MDIKTVTVIGASGSMGSNVAGIFASFGDAKVYAVGRDIDKVNMCIPKIVNSVKAGTISSKIYPADYSKLGACVADSDLVFESSVEDMSIKKELHKQIASHLKNDAIACSGTSGLSISGLAECYPIELRKNFYGIHMFNPPYSMTLCELITTKYSNNENSTQLHTYLEKQLCRTVVEVKDSPAFLANRIGFYTINEALRMAEMYSKNGGIDYIDAIIGPFSGRVMAPIFTADFVGLDVHKAIVDNIYENVEDYAHESFALPQYVNDRIAEKKLGGKTGCGLYWTDFANSSAYRQKVWDIETKKYRECNNYNFPFAEQMKLHISSGNYSDALRVLIQDSSQEAKICVELLLKYILYSVYSANEVGGSLEDADDVMATGFNWCPPLALYYAILEVTDVESLIANRIPEIAKKVDWKRLSEEIQPSKYNYRIYFRTK